jgi:hypothetical protein
MIGQYRRNEREKLYWGCFLSRADPESLLISLRVLLRSRASARIGKRKEPPGRKKIAIAGMIFAIFFRCLFISFLSSLVHFSSVFRVFIRSCIRPVIERTSISMASLLIMNSLLRYLLIIGKPATTAEFRSGSGTGLFRYWKCPVSRLPVNLHIKIFLDHRQTGHNGRGQVGLRTGFILLTVTLSTKLR